MRLEQRRRAAVVLDSTDKWRLPVVTEEADHAQVKGSSAAPFPRTEPAPDRPQLLHFAKHVHEYLSAAQAADVKWPAPEHWDDQQIERTLFPQRPATAIWRKHPEPDWKQIHQELQTHKNLTLQLVWQEGRESNPDGYGYGYSRYVAAVFMLRTEPTCWIGALSAETVAT